MKTIKSYTDIEQSKKLIRILPLDSADLRYGYIAPYDYGDRKYDGGYDKIPYPKDLSNKIQLIEEYSSELPCWSLAALLEIIRNSCYYGTKLRCSHIAFDYFRSHIEKDEVCCITVYTTSEKEQINVYADNELDAAVNVILKLHEQKLL